MRLRNAYVVGLALLGGARIEADDLRHFADATLRAVQFIDAKEGWAAGDEGVVWHTIDGGATWERQPTGSRSSLRSLCFLDPFVGWAAGREELPGGRTAGVLLHTRDGGVSWQRLLPGTLPGLNQIRFLDERRGFVLGDGTDTFGSGVFFTRDGGKTWAPLPGPRTTSWLAGDFADAENGLLAGVGSRLATLKGDRFGTAEVESLGGRRLHALQMTAKRALAAGQGGLLLASVSGGARWGFADTGLPRDLLACLDWNGMHAVGGQLWVVGRPGSVLLHSTDHGASWTLRKTGQTLPLHGVFFLDEKRGWAVGDLGTILASTDGGTTWKVQRRGGTRLAALCVHAERGSAPLDVLARLGAAEGYLVGSLQSTCPAPAQVEVLGGHDAARTDYVLRRAGGVQAETLWQFPLPPQFRTGRSQDLLESWNGLHGGQAPREVLRQLVLTLRIWRPDVVVTEDPAGMRPAETLTAEALKEAVRQAADPKAFPEQLTDLGLSAWQVQKVYVPAGAKDASVVLDNLEPHERLRGTPQDHARAAADLLSGKYLPPARRSYRLWISTRPEAAAAAHFLDGLSQTVGETRRDQRGTARIDPDLRQALTTRRNLMALAERIDAPERLLGNIDQMLARLPEDQAAAAAFAIGSHHARQGEWTLARETFLLMVDRHPAHPLAAEAYRWLIRHAGSSEARRRHELKQFVAVADFRPRPPAIPEKIDVKKQDPKNPIRQVVNVETVGGGRLSYLSDRAETRQWYRGSLEIGKRLAGFGPLHSLDPTVQFPLQAARRRLGEFEPATEWMSRFHQHAPAGPWKDAAAAELWLVGKNTTPPARLAICRSTGERPHLDGKLNEACWKGLEPLLLRSSESKEAPEFAAEAFLAYDREYLYLAARCRHPQGLQVPVVKKRARDADLDGHDRIAFLFDLDRDHATYFRLEVDQRGCVREDCWGDRGWNPKWYVALASGQDGWTMEAALPLVELTGEKVALNSAWSCNVVRTVPGRLLQAWSFPAGITPRPEGMGLMVFRAPPDPRSVP